MNMIGEITEALQREEHVLLATIISTHGSTPAAALSKMLVTTGGTVSSGTVGGGCMEGDVILHANRLYQTGTSEILTFHLNEDDLQNGLLCGGSLDVLLETVPREQLQLYQRLKALREEGEDCVLGTILCQQGMVERKFLIHQQHCLMINRGSGVMQSCSVEELHDLLHSSVTPLFQHSIRDVLDKVHRRNETQRVTLQDGTLILEPVVGTPALIIFGGGHVSKYVCRAAAMAGFRVTVVDDREYYAHAARFPDAAQTFTIDFMESFHQLTMNPSTYVVIVTRGHQYDEQILELALSTPAKYIGMIGSKRKVVTTYEHLLEKGVIVDQFKRVYAPVGIEIGAVTAEEIAVSIVAQLIRVRRGEETSLFDKSAAMTDILKDLTAR